MMIDFPACWWSNHENFVHHETPSPAMLLGNETSHVVGSLRSISNVVFKLRGLAPQTCVHGAPSRILAVQHVARACGGQWAWVWVALRTGQWQRVRTPFFYGQTIDIRRYELPRLEPHDERGTAGAGRLAKVVCNG